MIAGRTTRPSVPGRPKSRISGVVSSGPRAKPTLPPTENMLMPRPRLIPAAMPA